MPTLDFLYYLALGTSADVPQEELVDVEEHLSSPSATPIPSRLGIIRGDSPTASPVPIVDASEVVRSAGKVMARLAFLPTDAADEAMVDELLRARQASKARRPIPHRS